jgi:hypothetical protein
MSKAKDVEVQGVGVASREHTIGQVNGRKKYPFKAMVRNDFFFVGSWPEALQVRNALKTFYRRYADRTFTVRQAADEANVWVIRRVE